MPALPKFRDGAGEKRACKIFRQGNAENLRGAERGIHRAGKIHVQLHGKTQCGKGNHGTVVFFLCVKYGFDKQIQPVCNQQFFEKPEQNAPGTEQKSLISDPFGRIELLCCLRIAADRALRDLRKKRKKKGKAQEIAIRRNFSLIYVRQIRNCLQRIKRNADGQQKSRNLKSKGSSACLEQMIDILRKEWRIFQCEQNAKVQRYCKQEYAELPFFACSSDRLFLLPGAHAEQSRFVFLQPVQPNSEIVNGEC